MAPRAKPAKKGGGRSLKEQINGIDPEERQQFFDELHAVHDAMAEDHATGIGKINRIYDKACNELDVSKDALTFLFKEERSQRQKASRAARMDSRARDSLERLSASLPEGSPMSIWASNMAKIAGTQAEATSEA